MCLSHVHVCQTSEMAGCTNLDVRLVDGQTGLEGRVEICVNGVWAAVLSSYPFTNEVARVICNQLGYPSECEHIFCYYNNIVLFKVYVSSSSGTIPLTTSVFARGIVPVLVGRILCLRDALTLQDCYHVRTYSVSTSRAFTYYNYAVNGIICQGNVTSETECIPGDAKLVGGSKVNEGRVEVCIDGFWGTICDEGWDDDDASVICQQLGLSATGNYTTR